MTSARAIAYRRVIETLRDEQPACARGLRIPCARRWLIDGQASRVCASREALAAVAPRRAGVASSQPTCSPPGPSPRLRCALDRNAPAMWRPFSCAAQPPDAVPRHRALSQPPAPSASRTPPSGCGPEQRIAPTHPEGRQRDPAHPGPTAWTRVFQLLASVGGLCLIAAYRYPTSPMADCA
jgi:hypothetical protein